MLMRGHQRLATTALAALVACALIAAGCGDDDSTSDTSATTSTSATTTDGNASASIDAAVQSCTDKAGNIQPEAAGSALAAACKTVGENAKQALSQGSDQVDSALAQAADSCKQAVSSLPSGEAQSALTDLCDAIKADE